jgi:hypothetical protein
MRSMFRIFVLAAVFASARGAFAFDRAAVSVPISFKLDGETFPADRYQDDRACTPSGICTVTFSLSLHRSPRAGSLQVAVSEAPPKKSPLLEDLCAAGAPATALRLLKTDLRPDFIWEFGRHSSNSVEIRAARVRRIGGFQPWPMPLASPTGSSCPMRRGDDLHPKTDREQRYVAALRSYLHADPSQSEKAVHAYAECVEALFPLIETDGGTKGRRLE